MADAKRRQRDDDDHIAFVVPSQSAHSWIDPMKNVRMHSRIH